LNRGFESGSKFWINEMDENRKRALKSKLLEGIDSAHILWGHIDPWSLSVGLKPFMRELDKSHKQWISELEIIFLLKTKIEPLLTDVKITGEEQAIDQYTSRPALELKAEEIVNFLSTFPRKYYFYYKLPNLEHDFFNKREVTKNISFIKISDGHRLGLSDGYYLKILGEGYCENSRDSSAFVSSISKFKQVAYLSFLTKKFELEKYYTKIDKNLSFIPCFDIEFPNDIKRTFVSDSFLKYLNYIVINRDFLKILKARDEAQAVPVPMVRTGLAVPALKVKTGLAALLADKSEPEFLNLKLKYLLDTPDNDLNTSSLKNAMEWAYDSKINEYDQTMSFVQLSVALEAVLGVCSKKDGVTERLADRCAYLIGNNVEEREKIKVEFEKFYNVRSHLIHGRSKRLNNEEASQLYWGACTLDKVIGRELDLYNLHKKAIVEELRNRL